MPRKDVLRQTMGIRGHGRSAAKQECYNDDYKSATVGQVGCFAWGNKDLKNDRSDRQVKRQEKDLGPQVDDVAEDRYLACIPEQQHEDNQHNDNLTADSTSALRSPTHLREDLIWLRQTDPHGKIPSKGGPKHTPELAAQNPPQSEGGSELVQTPSAEGLQVIGSQRGYTGTPEDPHNKKLSFNDEPMSQPANFTTNVNLKRHKGLHGKANTSMWSNDPRLQRRSLLSLAQQSTGQVALFNNQQDDSLAFHDGREPAQCFMILGVGTILLFAALYAKHAGSWPEGAYVEYLVSSRLPLNIIPRPKKTPSSYSVREIRNKTSEVKAQQLQTGPGRSILKDARVRVAFPNVARNAEQRLDYSRMMLEVLGMALCSLPTPTGMERHFPFAWSDVSAPSILQPYFDQLHPRIGDSTFTVVVYICTYRMHKTTEGVYLTLLVDATLSTKHSHLIRFAMFGTYCKSHGAVNSSLEDLKSLSNPIGGPQGMLNSKQRRPNTDLT